MANGTIEIEKVDLIFGRRQLLKNINLKIEAGQKLALIGPSGQGKSTLIKIISGLIRPSSGRILINGESLYDIDDHKRHQIMREMGMLFQKNALFDSLSVGENVGFPLKEVKGLSDSQVDLQVNQMLDAVGLMHAKNLFPDEISGGMQKRAGIARGLVLEPKILFYDDPTAGLDPITSRKIIDLIIDLQKKHQSTVIAITNEMARAYQFADRILMLIDQQIIDTGPPSQTKIHSDPRVRQFIEGRLEGPLALVAQ